MNVSKMEIVPVRKAFPHEAHNFTVWLESNIDALSERIGLKLTVLEREKPVGSFNVDLFCEDGKGNYAIIENQLEKSDHDHLGKLLTYLVNLDAKTAIWVTPEVRPEHERVIDWLNESTNADYSFYLVQVEAARIGNSPYAPLFTILAEPDEQMREIGDEKKDLAQGKSQRREFWTQLLERSKGQTKLFSGRTTSTDSWLSTSAGHAGIHYSYSILKKGIKVELYIDTGNKERNKAIFDELVSQKDTIETDFGEELNWWRLDEYRASAVNWRNYDSGGINEPDLWLALQDMLIASMRHSGRELRD